MAKPINLTISFSIPKGVKLAKASIKPDGEIVLIDEEGKIITPEHMERSTHYNRDKGPKIQSRSKVENQSLSVGGLKEFAEYDAVFAIDTNKRVINGIKVHAACFIRCNFATEENQTRIECDGKLNIYEFHNIPDNENPEMLAVLKVARDVSRTSDSDRNLNIAFVTDSDIESHDKISKRKIPIYKKHLLPPGFTLHYASTDTGSEAINRILRFCDKQSSNYLKYLEEGTVRESELMQLEEDQLVQYRYMFRDDVELINPVSTGITMRSGTKVTLYGIK